VKKRLSFAFLLLMVSSCAFASIAIDATSFRDRSSAATSIATPAFSTAAANELLLAFVSTDSSSPNMTVTSVSGAGLTWTPVVRANKQLGTAEIWRAFATSKLTNVTVTASLAQSVAASIVVVAFTGVDTSGTGGSGAIGAIASASAASGAPTATLTPTRNGSWVFGVGADWDNRIARTVGSGQTLVHQYLATIGDTYWVQRQNGPTSVAGTSVTINDTAPTTDRYNLGICEILPSLPAGPDLTPPSVSMTAPAGGTYVKGTVSVSANASDNVGIASVQFRLDGGNLGSAVTASPYGTSWNTSGSSGQHSLSAIATDTSGNATTTAAVAVTVDNTPPAVGMTGPPAGTVSGTISLSASASDTSPILGVQFLLDNANLGAEIASSPYSLSWDSTTVANGNHSLSARARDAAGNTAVATAVAVSVNNPTPPPSIAMTAPAANAYVKGTITVSANATDPTGISSVQFLLDGANLGSALTAAPYSLQWDTTTAAIGGHTLSATATNTSGNTATATALNVTVDNTAPVISITGPAAGTVTGTTTLTASASDNTSIAGVQFLLDGNNLGAEVTTAPYSKSWDSTTVASGNHLLSARARDAAGNTATAANVTLNVNNPPPAGLAIDTVAFGDRSSNSATISTAAFSTHAANEVLFAFIATDAFQPAVTVQSISGGSLTWNLVVRTNVQMGTAEIWRALAPNALTNVTVTATLSQSAAASITIVSFTGADTTGTNASGAVGAVAQANSAGGAPSTSLNTTRNGSWVFGVGNDYSNAVARTLGSGQTLVHQYLATVGDTYWVQRQNAPTPPSGTTVTINDTAPTGDMYNLSVVEILPVSTVVDTTPPAVSMISPAPNATVAGPTTVAANATDNVAVAGVQFLLDGNKLGSELLAPPYSLTWDTITVGGGTHTLAAIARDSSGNSTTSNTITITVDNSGNPAAVAGSWSPVVTLPAVAVNLILLPNGKLLFYEDGATSTVWDYVNGTFTNISATPNLFCSGHALLADGRVLVVGGYGGSGTQIGIANADIFDPTNNTWTAVPNMAYRRWYPTATTLADGRILVTAGWQTTNHTNAGVPEIYDVTTNRWTQLTSANNPFETYPFIYLLPDGRIIHVGGSEYPTVTEALNLTTLTWTTIDSRIIDGGSSAMYLPGKIMKAGSASDSQNTGASSNTTFVLDTTQATPAWQQTPSMAYPRSYLNLTVLPDGNVLATGGETDKDGGNIANAVYAAELWSPQTQTWTTMASMKTPREYHATALLLPDGRVAVSGMGADFGNVPNENNAEFFSPPYLFKGARPTITQNPPRVAYGSQFFVGTPDGASISKVVLIRTGAVTHFFDQNTRYVPLVFQQSTGGLTVTGPVDGNLAPPGYYMLFLVNSNGVPSIAPIIPVGP